MRETISLLCVLALTAPVLGCESSSDDSGSTAASGGTGGVGGAGGAAGAGGAVPGCALDIQWQAGTDLPAPRDHHHTLGVEVDGNTYLVVAGGWNYAAIFNDASSAAIADDGLVGAWQTGPVLPTRMAGGGAVAIGNRIYLAAGQTGGSLLSDVVTSDVSSDGQLSDWAAGAALPEGRFHPSMSHVGNQLILTGGLQATGFTASDSLFRATLDDGGDVGAWTSQTLPSPRSHHASFAVDDWVYMVGGLSGSPTGQYTLLDDVVRAPVGSDGAVGEWEQVGQLPAQLATMAPLVRGRCAYLFAGLQGLSYSDAVLAAPIDDDGRTGEWATLPTPIPVGRSHMHHVVLAHDRVYLAGGSVDYQNVTAGMQIGTFVQQ